MSPILLFTLPKFAKPTIFDATVIVAGISIVIGVLVLLIFVFMAFGAVAPRIDAWSQKREAQKAEKKARKQAQKLAKKNGGDAGDVQITPSAVEGKPSPMPIPEPKVEAGTPNEIVAAISAAVAVSEGSGAVVRSIKKKNVSGRNPWSSAAAYENTRPF